MCDVTIVAMLNILYYFNRKSRHDKENEQKGGEKGK